MASWHCLCSIPLIQGLISPHHILYHTIIISSCLPLNSTYLISLYVCLACICFHLKFLKFHTVFLLYCAGHTKVSDTMYAIITSAEHYLLTPIYHAHKPCSILLYLDFLHMGPIANFNIVSLEVGCLVKVMFTDISQLLLLLYINIHAFLLSFLLHCASC